MPNRRADSVSAQLDMLGALDKPNGERERFVEKCIMAIKNNQYIQMRIQISDLPKDQKKWLTDNMAEMNLTFCHAVFPIGQNTAKYRHWSQSRYDKLAVVPDELSHYGADDMDIIREYLTNSLNRITGLFIANRTIVDLAPYEQDKTTEGFKKVLEQLNRIIRYVK